MYSINIDLLPSEADKINIIEKNIVKDSIALSFCYGSNFKNTRVIRRFVELMSVRIWMSEEWVNRMILIVDELNNNAIEHWSTDESGSEMRIELQKIENYILVSIEVEDSWTGPNPKKAMDMQKLRADAEDRWFKHHTSIRWRWLFLIISQLVDNLYFKDSLQGWLIV